MDKDGTFCSSKTLRNTLVRMFWKYTPHIMRRNKDRKDVLNLKY